MYRLLLDARTEESVGHLGAAMALLRRAEAADTAYLVPELAELNRIQDAAAIYARIDTTRLPGLENYWSGRAYTLHRLGRFQEELSVVDAGLARTPDNPRLQSARVRAMAALKSSLSC